MSLLAAFVFLADTIIVPIRGDLVRGLDGSYFSSVRVTNTGSAPVSVRRDDVYPLFLLRPCTEPETVVVESLETIDVPTGCLGLFAYTLTSDGPLRVDGVITTTRPMQLPVGFTSTWHYQQFTAAREWLPANRRAIIPAVTIADDYVRTNFFVTNPNNVELTLRVETTRRSPQSPSRNEEHVIAPRSTRIVPLSGIDDPECRLPLVCGAEYRLILRADAPYYASVSAVDYLGDALFLSASAIDE